MNIVPIMDNSSDSKKKGCITVPMENLYNNRDTLKGSSYENKFTNEDSSENEDSSGNEDSSRNTNEIVSYSQTQTNIILQQTQIDEISKKYKNNQLLQPTKRGARYKPTQKQIQPLITNRQVRNNGEYNTTYSRSELTFGDFISQPNNKNTKTSGGKKRGKMEKDRKKWNTI